MFQKITMNLGGQAKKRYESLEGRTCLVVPAVMLTEGVHAGSQGPLYYPPEELSKYPEAWNHKPIVVYHPTLNGEGISACDPSVVQTRKVGTLFNTSWDGRLRTECWLDEERLKSVDPRVLDAINKGEMVEVSTGLFHDPEAKQGVWNNESYVGIARNYRPDHLALLPDEKGACSISDGAGLLRNASKQIEGGLSLEDIRCQVQDRLREMRKSGDAVAPFESYCYVCDVYSKFVIFERDGKSFKIDYKVKNNAVSLVGEPEEVRKVTSYVTANGEVAMPSVRNEDHQGPIRLPMPSVGELSDVMRRQQFQKALQEHYSGIQQEGDWGGWVTDLYANYVVYSKNGKTFRLPYTYDDDKIRFDGEPEEVERVSEYRAKTNTPIDGTQSPYTTVNRGGSNVATPAGKPTQNVMHQGAHQLIHDATQHADAHHAPGEKSDSQLRTAAGGGRKEQVSKMISGGHAKEEDRKFLEDLPDDHFERVSSYVLKGANQPIVPYTYEGVGDRSNAHGPGNVNLHNRQQITTEQYIASAPPEIRQLLQNGLAAHNQQKQELIGRITANSNNRFTPEWLALQDIPMLQGLASLAGTRGPVQNYAGQGEVPMFIQSVAPTTNAAPAEGLPLPQMTFEKN